MPTVKRYTHNSINPATGAAYGKLSGSTALTVTLSPSATQLVLTLEPESGAAGTVDLLPVPPGATASKITAPASSQATIGTDSGLVSTERVDAGTVVLTPALTGNVCGWHLVAITEDE